jgi:hypothetical protein
MAGDLLRAGNVNENTLSIDLLNTSDANSKMLLLYSKFAIY